jgi:hypothetical protein
MTISVADLFDRCGLKKTGTVQWGQRILLDEPGVYVVSSTPDPNDAGGTILSYSHAPASFRALRQVCPDVAVDGKPATDEELTARIGAFWIPNSAVLYIGLAGTSLQNRVNQYYATRIGHRSPHAGGWWLKTMNELASLYVHYAPTSDPNGTETALLEAYAESVPASIRRTLHDPERIAPFANVDLRKGFRKRHGLTGYKVQRRSGNVGTLGDTAVEKGPKPAAASDLVTPVSASGGTRVEAQVITDADRSGSNLRVSARSKYALPSTDGFLTLTYRGAVSEVRWRVNGSRSGTIGLGKNIMRTLGTPGRSVWLIVNGTRVEIEG